ncbi:hypothetical protein ACFYUK_39535 [Nonomuraea wenchangensis]
MDGAQPAAYDVLVAHPPAARDHDAEQLGHALAVGGAEHPAQALLERPVAVSGRS